MSDVSFIIRPDIKEALDKNRPVLALESTILAHGMPYPDNLEFAKHAENIILGLGVLPATVAIINGEIKIGLTREELEFVCKTDYVYKTTLSEISDRVAKRDSGATTVSATMHIAYLAGIRVFSTGGIGGVHRNFNTTFDASQDLTALSNIPMIVVSAGAKVVLDLPKTLETLETLSISVIGYNTSEFPAFYYRSSGLPINNRAETIDEIIHQFASMRRLKIKSAMLVVNPIKKEDEIPATEINDYLDYSFRKAEENQVSGKDVTPFLLKTIMEKSGGECIRANKALALNNVELGSKIALRLFNI